MKQSTLNFEEAFRELKEISQALEDNKLPVDQLSALVKRAAQLSEFCKTRLREIGKEIDDVFPDDSRMEDHS